MKLSKREKVFISIIVILSIALLFCISELMSKNVTNTSSKTDNGTNEETTTSDTNQAISDSESIKDEEKGELTEISLDEYLALKSSTEKSVIYIARPTCTFCEKQEPITRNMVYKYGIKIHYLNTDNLDADGQNTLINSDDIFKEGVSTPTTIIVENNKVVDAIVGLTTIENYTNFLRDYGMIK